MWCFQLWLLSSSGSKEFYKSFLNISYLMICFCWQTFLYFSSTTNSYFHVPLLILLYWNSEVFSASGAVPPDPCYILAMEDLMIIVNVITHIKLHESQNFISTCHKKSLYFATEVNILGYICMYMLYYRYCGIQDIYQKICKIRKDVIVQGGTMVSFLNSVYLLVCISSTTISVVWYVNATSRLPQETIATIV